MLMKSKMLHAHKFTQSLQQQWHKRAGKKSGAPLPSHFPSFPSIPFHLFPFLQALPRRDHFNLSAAGGLTSAALPAAPAAASCRSLSEDASKTLVQAFVSCRLDYCNSLFFGISEGLMNWLQLVQNAAVRLVTGTRHSDHISPVLRQLH